MVLFFGLIRIRAFKVSTARIYHWKILFRHPSGSSALSEAEMMYGVPLKYFFLIIRRKAGN